MLVAFWITMLTAQSENSPLCNKLRADSYEISRIALQWYKEQLIHFLDDLDHHGDSPNRETAQYGANELPWPRRSALSECSYHILLWLTRKR